MATMLLLRHGRTAANAAGVLAGWTPGVALDDLGQAQAAAVAQRLVSVGISEVVSSPLQRCEETAAPLLAARDLSMTVDERFGECHYGDWTGLKLKDLAKLPLWKTVQQQPSAAHFPGGESLGQMQARAVAAVREHDRRVTDEFGPLAVWLAVSHGDVIKAILADALGMHLDLFQRIVVDPASLSVVRYTDARPYVERMNDTGGAFAVRKARRRRQGKLATDDAPVGGGAG